MCGIAGIVDFDETPSPDAVRAMCRAIRHRGPDDEGIQGDPFACLGHARLSIIDLSLAGHQPMTNENRDLWITFNGEIYNYREIKQNLRHNHTFVSRCDTEVLVHFWEERNEMSLPNLNGIFAFGMWDSKLRQLTLARDHCGVKPIYYWQRGNRLVFGSEIKAILAAGIPRTLNYAAVAEHFTFQNIFDDKTFFTDVHLLPAGCYLQFDSRGCRITRYHEFEFPENALETAPKEVQERLLSSFSAAVTRQLVSDVPVGSYLSGGMDTGSIAAIAARSIPKMHTFSCGFDIAEEDKRYHVFDESGEAEFLSKRLNTIHHAITLGHEEFERSVVQTVWHLDEPRMGVSYQNYRIAETVGKHVKVVLSGVGGDELFAGYPWRYRWCTENASDRSAYESTVRFFNDTQIAALFTPETNKALSGYSSWEEFRKLMAACTATDPFNRALFIDLKTFLNGILVVDDKLNMAFSVESRVPILDLDLVSLAQSIPPGMKLSGDTGKVVLRKAMTALLPERFTMARKQGFTPPDRVWLQKYTMPYVESVVFSSEARSRGIFEEQTIRAMIREHLDGKKDHRFFLWSLVCFEHMMRLFFDRCTEEKPA
jgi:asparagine synthase (glutamine-hydrolysing)